MVLSKVVWQQGFVLKDAYCTVPLWSHLLYCSYSVVLVFAGKPSFTKKQADLFFPPDFADDFPVAMQVPTLPMIFPYMLNGEL